MYKAACVKAQKQFRKHACHWPGCSKQVPPAMWGCALHWYRLPLRLRRAVWAAFEPGQEVSRSPSPEYLRVADEVQRWIATEG